MNSFSFNSVVLRPIRFMISVCLCTMLLFATALPAFAIANPPTSDPTEGPAQLNETYDKTEEVLKKPPLTLEETAQRASRGLNEVQENADLDEMKNSGTSQSEFIEEGIKGFVDKVTGKK